MAWTPARTHAEVDAILCAPGNIHEIQTCLVDGRLQRVYKNAWPSLRDFWLWSSAAHADATYIVFENRRLTFSQVFRQSIRVAAIYYNIYGIRKGDRVGICSRNYPEYLVAFWACHGYLWIHYVIVFTLTQCKLAILDAERADRLEQAVTRLSNDAGVQGFIVIGSQEGKGQWKGMCIWETLLEQHQIDHAEFMKKDPGILPEDNATILFTSGTTGLPKGVLSTQRQYVTNIVNVLVGRRRAILRRGEDVPEVPPPGPQSGVLVAVPFFHVTGSTSSSMMASLLGLKIVLMRKWVVEEAARLIKEENVKIAGGVPSMVLDLIRSSLAGHPLEALMFGGAPAPSSLSDRAKVAFPTAVLSEAYGLTETNSVAVAVAAEDYLAHPGTCGLPMPINDLCIINDDISVPPGVVGEVWVRGPNIMKEYWGDKPATDKVITKDGWFKTGDLGYLDQEGFLYIRDRIKDIIIRGGENIDSVSVENALYKDDRVLEVAAVGVPDERLGELVTAIVCIKPEHRKEVTEDYLIDLAKKSLPKFAVPVMVIIQTNPLERTPSGKILKADLRKMAREAWLNRSKGGVSSKL